MRSKKVLDEGVSQHPRLAIKIGDAVTIASREQLKKLPDGEYMMVGMSARIGYNPAGRHVSIPVYPYTVVRLT